MGFTVHGSRFTVHGSQFTVHSSQFTVHSSQFAVSNTLGAGLLQKILHLTGRISFWQSRRSNCELRTANGEPVNLFVLAPAEGFRRRQAKLIEDPVYYRVSGFLHSLRPAIEGGAGR